MKPHIKKGDRVILPALFMGVSKGFVSEDIDAGGNVWIKIIVKADIYNQRYAASQLKLDLTREQINAATDRGE